jgi:hypothetical protein
MATEVWDVRLTDRGVSASGTTVLTVTMPASFFGLMGGRLIGGARKDELEC